MPTLPVWWEEGGGRVSLVLVLVSVLSSGVDLGLVEGKRWGVGEERGWKGLVEEQIGRAAESPGRQAKEGSIPLSLGPEKVPPEMGRRALLP